MKTKRISLENLEKKPVFKLPDGYFDTLAVQIKNEIKIESFGKNSVFKSPENYFDNFSERLQQRISEHENAQICLDKIKKTLVFKVNEHYFEETPLKIEEKIKLISAPKLNVAKKTFKFSWLKQRIFSAAASVLLIIAGSWFFLAKQQQNQPEIALENIGKQEIVSYLQEQDLSSLDYSKFPISAKIKQTSADSLLIRQLNLNKNEILQHLEKENVEEEI